MMDEVKIKIKIIYEDGGKETIIHHSFLSDLVYSIFKNINRPDLADDYLKKISKIYVDEIEKKVMNDGQELV